MSKKEKLFELIGTLDKQEKRYVDLYIRRHASQKGNYVLLFRSMSGQKNYNEQALKSRLKGHPLLNSFAVTKHYLYDIVLKALADYHRSSTAQRRLGELILHTELLFEKKLYRQCVALARKGIRIAQDHERNDRLLELIDMELRCLHALTEVKEMSALNEKVLKQKECILEEQLRLFRLQKLSYDSFIDLKTRWVKAQKKKSPAYAALLSWEQKDLRSNRARILYHQTLSAHYFSANDLEHAYRQLMLMAAIFEKKPSIIPEYTNQYIALLNNLNLLLFERNDFARILSNIEKLKNVKARTTDRKARVKERLVNVELNVYKHTGDFEKGRPVLEEALKMLEEGRTGEVYRMLFLFDLCLFHLAFNDPRAALRYLNRFMAESNVKLREDLQKTARILNMILHYELGNYDYFDSLLLSSKRFFKKIDVLDPMEELFLAFFPKVIACTAPPEKRAAFAALHQQLQVLAKNKQLYETYLQNFDLVTWAVAHLGGISFSRAVKEKYAGMRKNQYIRIA